MKYRKRPVEVEAFQWSGDIWELWEWILSTGHELQKKGWPHKRNADGTLTIKTLEGDHLAQHGDWIIRGVAGEFYPCKPEIFAATYERVEDEACRGK